MILNWYLSNKLGFIDIELVLIEFFMVPQETMIHRLVMINHNFDALKKLNFWRDNGHVLQTGAEGSAASRPDRKVSPLDQPLSQKPVFRNLHTERGIKLPRAGHFTPCFLHCNLIGITVAERVVIVKVSGSKVSG